MGKLVIVFQVDQGKIVLNLRKSNINTVLLEEGLKMEVKGLLINQIIEKLKQASENKQGVTLGC